MRKHQIIKLKRFTLLFFIFSLPFEFWDPFGIASFFSVTKMSGFLYAGISFLTIRDSFDLPTFRYVKFLIAFWVWLVILSLLNHSGIHQESTFNFTILQNILLYWLIASDLKRKNIQIKALMLSFIISIFIMSLLLALGIGIGQEYVEGASRITFFNNNPNTVGLVSGLAIIFSLYFILYPENNFKKKGQLTLFALPGFINLLMLSASRGALITTALSFVIMVIMNKTTPLKRVLQFGILIIGASYFMEKLMESDLMYRRLTNFVEEQDTAGRGEIWNAAIEVAATRPLVGYGTTGFEIEMKKVFGVSADTHNLFLYILVTTGIIGLFIFFYFLSFHFNKIYQDIRRGSFMKLILMVFYLTTVIKAGGVIGNKLMWLLLAIIISAEFYESKKIKTI